MRTAAILTITIVARVPADQPGSSLSAVCCLLSAVCCLLSVKHGVATNARRPSRDDRLALLLRTNRLASVLSVARGARRDRLCTPASLGTHPICSHSRRRLSAAAALGPAGAPTAALALARALARALALFLRVAWTRRSTDVAFCLCAPPTSCFAAGRAQSSSRPPIRTCACTCTCCWGLAKVEDRQRGHPLQRRGGYGVHLEPCCAPQRGALGHGRSAIWEARWGQRQRQRQRQPYLGWQWWR